MKLQTIKIHDLSENVRNYLNGATTSMETFSTDLYMPKNIPFNQLLYMKTDKQLVAIKILMCVFITKVEDRKKFASCVRANGIVGGWCYLVQTPYGVEWRSDFYNKRFFYSKEEYFEHLESGVGGFEIESEMAFKQTHLNYCHMNFNESWKWNGHCAEQTNSLIKWIVLNEEGINIILSNYENSYWSKGDCIKANIEGMEIVDFPTTPNTLKINVEVVPTPPIVRTLTFVEK